nr:alanine racemase [uncultured Brevundimonas sp.]
MNSPALLSSPGVQCDEAVAHTGGLLRISLDAIVANYRAMAALVAPSVCAAVLKADAYGLGAVRIAPALYDAGCRLFFVAHLAEASALRRTLTADAVLYVLNGLTRGTEYAALATGATPVLNSREQVSAWADLARAIGRPLPAAIQFDTGMSRLGLPLEDAPWFFAPKGPIRWLDLRLAMSHLAMADAPDHPGSGRQRAAFEQAMIHAPAELPRSLANSAGCWLGPAYHYDVCRVGAALYGLDASPLARPMASVVEAFGRVIQTRVVPAGSGVGYGWTVVASRDMRLATVGVGYADGWPRGLARTGAAWFAGRRLPFLGRISMDSLVLDVSALPPDAIGPGDLVELLGPNRPLGQLAREGATIDYEVIARLGRRFCREYASS